MKLIAFVFIFILSYESSRSQQKYSDSLHYAFQTAKEDSDRVYTLNKLSEYYSYLYPDSALYYAEKIIELLTNHALSEMLKHNCMQKANDLFDPVANTVMIEKQFIKVIGTVKPKKKSKKVYGSRLDQQWVPNLITRSARNI